MCDRIHRLCMCVHPQYSIFWCFLIYSLIVWSHTQYLEVMQCPTNPTTAAAAQLVRMASAYHSNLLRYEGSDSNNSFVCPAGNDMASLTMSALPHAYVRLGESCLAEDPTIRPSFEEIVEALEQMMIYNVANKAHVSELSTMPSTLLECQSEGQEMAIQDATLIQEHDSPHEPCPSLSSASALQPQPFHSCLHNY